MKVQDIIIMAGGSGTRFWPRSRKGKPKQLLSFWDEKSLLEHTILRVAGLNPDRIWVVTTADLVESSRAALGDSLDGRIQFLGEPQGRNTAPCILWALSAIKKFRLENKIHLDDPVVILPADHFVGDQFEFCAALWKASELSEKSKGFVTLGVNPTRPETGYGYIERGKAASEMANAYLVSRFVEKPLMRDALRYVSSGAFYWNAGIFVVGVATGIAAFQGCMPHLYDVLHDAVMEKKPIESIYAKILADDAVSVDYGIMEHLPELKIPLYVLPVSFAWSDLGSFTALEDIDRSFQGNVIAHNAASNIVLSDGGLVALVGVTDLVVVRDGDVVLVVAKDQCQDIKKIVERIKKEQPQYS